MAKIYIIDVTNRDGVQTSRLSLSKLEKTMINLYLNEMGVSQSEAGFPTIWHEENYLRGNLKLVEKKVLYPIIISGWIRAVREDVKEAVKRVPKIKALNLSISTSEQMIYGKWRGKKTAQDILEMMTDAVDAAKEKKIKLIGVNAEDASRTDMKYLVKFASAAKDHGAHRIRYCDTLGYDDADTIYRRIRILAESVGLPIELHCHNDLGMAVACSVEGAKAAVNAGVDAYINTTINGVGERAGNADLVSTILALRKASGFKDKNLLNEKIDLSKSWKIASYAARAFRLEIPVNQPGVGKNAFAHESGIHVDGVLKDPKNYELYDSTELGRGEPIIVETGRLITHGEYTGDTGFYHVVGKQIGDPAILFKNPQQAKEISELARHINVHKQKPTEIDELKFVIKHPQIAAQIMDIRLPKLKEILKNSHNSH